MDSPKIIVVILSLLILVLSPVAASVGLFCETDGRPFEITSVRGEVVTIHGRGLYAHDSVSGAAQAIAQDVVTLALGVPLLAFALYAFKKRSLRGHLLLAGTLGYFLYTYASFAFMVSYNDLFLVYVVLVSTSLFAFILTLRAVDLRELRNGITDKYPRKSIVVFLCVVSLLLVAMWLGRILPSLTSDAIPFGLEHYSTLVIQTLDLGVIVPTGLLAAVLLLEKESWGYLLASVLLIKGVTMLTAITAMIVGELRAGVMVETAVVVAFPLLNLLAVWLTIRLFESVSDRAAQQGPQLSC